MKENNQETIGVRMLNDKEYLKELKKKLKEETEEFLNVEEENKLKEELADIQEVIDYLKISLKVDNNEFIKLKEKKEEKSGGFEKRIYLESVGVEEDNEWFKYYENNPDKYPRVEK